MIAQLATVLIALAIILVPAIFDYAANAAFELPKLALLCVLAIPALIASVSGWAIRQLRSPLSICALVWLLAVLLSTALSINPTRSLLGSYERQAGAISAIALAALGTAVAYTATSIAARWRIGSFIILSSIIPTAYGLIQRAGLDMLGWLGQPLGVTSTFGSSTALGGYLAAVAPWTLAALIRQRQTDGADASRTVTRIMLVALLCGQIAVIALTSVRGAIIAVALGLVVVAGLNSARLGRINWRVTVAAILTMLVVAGVALGIVTAIRGEGLVSDSESQAGDASFVVRLQLWRAASAAVINAGPRLLLGYGPDSQAQALEPFLPIGLSQRYPTIQFDRAHTAPLDIALTTGVLGALSLGGVFILALGRAAQWLRHANDEKSLLACAIMGSLAAHIVETGVAFPSVSSQMLVAVIIGVAASLTVSPTVPALPWRQSWRRRAFAVLALVGLIIAFSRPIQADHLFQRGLAFSSNLDARRASEQFQAAVSTAPWVDTYRIVAINETVSRAADAPRENSRRPSILDSAPDALALLRDAAEQSRLLTVWSPDDAFSWSTQAQTLHTAIEADALPSASAWTEAVQAAEQAQQLAPRRVLFLDRAARIAALSHAESRARDYYAQAVALDGQQAERIAEIGDTFRREGDPTSAERQYQQAISRDSRSAIAWSGMSQIFLARGQLNDALDASQRAARFQMRDWRYHAEVGRVYALVGDRQLAQQELRAAARLAPAWEWPGLRREIDALGLSD